MKMAKVRNYSRHDVIIVNGIKYDKNEWQEIDDGVVHEELTIIEQPVQKKRGKQEVKDGDW